MDLGVSMFVTDRTVAPDRLAREVEVRGFASLFVPEHTHMPVDHTPHPAGGGLPDEYRRTLDPFGALTAAALATSRLRVGTGICLAAQRDPILLAKETATLDLLSGGRFVFGVGYGWNRPEAAHHGVAFERRREILREKVLAVRSLWTEDAASAEGEHVRFGPSWSWPKPVQEPHPPILLGAAPGEASFAHVIEFCDGWMPIGARAVFDDLPRLRGMAEDAGRDPDSISITVYGTRPDPGRLTELADAGVDHVVLALPSADPDATLAALDDVAGLVEEVA